MSQIADSFLLGTEIECLTAVPDDPSKCGEALVRFLDIISRLVPSLPGPSGIFTTYGRVYVDCDHIELATAECDSPYMLCLLVEQLQSLAAQAINELARQGIRLVLANNNHSGLLQKGCPVFGDHENYLVATDPSEFAAEILPFLITRIYGGAGGVRYPDGAFLAGVRPTAMELAVGGGTTECRAIHSTARDEHHVGDLPGMFRCHTILADGHRSHFNLALLFGCTALAIKAVLWDRRLRAEANKLARQFEPNDPVAMLHNFNVLASPGQPLTIDPRIVAIQRLYLDGASRYAEAHPHRPVWVDRILKDWNQTLTAYERMDRLWLSARLDTFAKYEFYTAALQQSQRSWNDLISQQSLFHELALLDQNYHEFANPRSIFAKLESAGVLQHRVHELLQPGQEPDPYIPQTSTRARARALFIRDNSHRTDLNLDWSWAHDTNGRVCWLQHPFSTEFSEWQSYPSFPADRPLRRTSIAGHILQMYDRGEYEAAFGQVIRYEAFHRTRGNTLPPQIQRYQSWIQARRGQPEARELVQQIHANDRMSLHAINDVLCVHRFLDLIPDVEALQSTIDRGLAQIQIIPHLATNPVAVLFLEHTAYILVHANRPEAAEQILQPLTGQLVSMEDRVRARVMATMGEICRARGDYRRARRLLHMAAEIQTQNGYLGYLADFTYPSLAKATSRPRRALEWLNKAKEIQTRTENRMGLTVSLLLEARIRRTLQVDDLKIELTRLQSEIPALQQSAFLTMLLTQWMAWIRGDMLEGNSDMFWGL